MGASVTNGLCGCLQSKLIILWSSMDSCSCTVMLLMTLFWNSNLLGFLIECVQLIGLIFIFIFAVFGLQFFSDRAEVKLVCCCHKLLELQEVSWQDCVWQPSFGTFSRAVTTLVGIVTSIQVILIACTIKIRAICSDWEDLQGWPEELPLIIPSEETGSWQLDIPVVMFGFGYCVTVLLILVQVSKIRPFL